MEKKKDKQKNSFKMFHLLCNQRAARSDEMPYFNPRAWSRIKRMMICSIEEVVGTWEVVINQFLLQED
jgi:hypothetical protein